jgi:hypothetical protein
MPKALHEKLKRQARRKGLSGEAFDRYVYGTMNEVESRKKKKKRKKKAR